MRISHILSIIRRNECRVLRKIYFNFHNSYHFKTMPSVKKKMAFPNPLNNIRKLHDGSDSEEEILTDLNDTSECGARELLYQHSKGYLLAKITNSVSVQELFDVFSNNRRRFRCEHFAQTVFVLYDLKTIFLDMNRTNKSSSDFISKLNENETWRKILHLIKDNINNFNSETLSYVVFYLSKLGITIENELIQLSLNRIKNDLIKNFSLKTASVFLETVFLTNNLRNFFLSQDLVPLIYNCIDSCNSIKEFEELTVCLNKLHRLVTNETFDKYKDLVASFITEEKLTAKNHKTILKVLEFLNYPKLRESSTILITKCVLLLKNNLNLLTINELILLYEIFHDIREPAEILNELQRNSSRHFQQLLDEDLSAEKLKLFSSIIYFSSPFSRVNFKTFLYKYVEDCRTIENFILLRRILCFMKISDRKLCELYWNKVLKILKSNKEEEINLSKLCLEYTNFNIDIDNYRHNEFENELMSKLKQEINVNIPSFFPPKKFSNVLNFVLIYGNDQQFLELLVNKLGDNWEQLNHIDCLKISSSLNLFMKSTSNKYLKYKNANKISELLTKIMEKHAENDERLQKSSILLKSCIYRRNDLNSNLINKLLSNCRKIDPLSSKNIENISFYLLTTNTLIPELLDKFSDYVVKYPENVVGFNVERIVYLCYLFGYSPKNHEKFLEIATNILIRDQNRLGGLSFIQSALALCFFNKLPESFIKSIFNTEFLDKLDTELANCYSKDIYPLRVRSNLMQLNRAVCLGYPELNVPWFHQEYVKEIQEIERREEFFKRKFKDCLNRTVGKSDVILENVITPYGYHIDYVVNLNEENKAVSSDISLDSKTKKLAIILLPQNAFTKILVQLKGKYQLKRKHLEILGFQVVMISHNDCINLFYTDDRIEYLSNIIWPKSIVDVTLQND